MVPDGSITPQQKPLTAADIEGDLRLYHGAIRSTGFLSTDLQRITQPVLVVTGELSHPRFADVSKRLIEVVPNTRAASFPSRSHLHSPQRHEPEALAKVLLQTGTA